MTADLRRTFDQLVAMVAEYGPAVAYSGGVDSSLVLRAASEAHGPAACGLIAATPMHPADETARALANAAGIGVRVEKVVLDPLDDPDIRANPPERCYHCKRKIYTAFLDRLGGMGGASVLMDGTNLDDLDDYRPGRRALAELGVATPLADLGIGKRTVRRLARMLGLAAWDYPSSSCLATRIPAGTELTRERLGRVATAEKALADAGFSGCRVRLFPPSPDRCAVELRAGDMGTDLPALRSEIMKLMRGVGFSRVYLDLEGRI